MKINDIENVLHYLLFSEDIPHLITFNERLLAAMNFINLDSYPNNLELYNSVPDIPKTGFLAFRDLLLSTNMSNRFYTRKTLIDSMAARVQDLKPINCFPEGTLI